MKIEVNLFEKNGISNAINALQEAEKRLVTAFKEFLDLLLDEIEERANNYVLSADIGSNVKNSIMSGWHRNFISNTQVELINDSQPAVFVEFGVGTIGKESPHVNAVETGYDYDVNSKHKLSDRSWIFKLTEDEDLDIKTSAIMNRTESTVRTKGSPAVMYLYNAMMDCVNLGISEKIWKQVKVKYW